MSCWASSSAPPFAHLSPPRPFQPKLRRPTSLLALPDSGSSRPATAPDEQQLNLSVLRFTLGIPGLDESYLPRWIGYGFGSLLVLNHLAGGSNSITPAQLRTETLGLSLAAFSVALPYLGRFLKGSTISDQATLPEDAKQIFVMSQSGSDSRMEDLAWATYVLLRNTNSISVIISVRDELCVRGYWSTPGDLSKGEMLDWFKSQISGIGLCDMRDVLYFPQFTYSEQWKMLPKGIQSLIVQPITCASSKLGEGTVRHEGFILLASNLSYAFSEKDRAWIRAIGNKFKGVASDQSLVN
uniref:Protein COFACTOR ASSEMBLY OF COMPLEX C SUBUNIT B CCB2, chloroplastic n=1 Tax=Kalanchoe fedtschenkoi TaxID=63787 RepID=A0A7N0RCV8_KALFE